MALLEVKDLRVVFPSRGETVLDVLRGVSFTVDNGERLGIVGESGAGKSMAAFAILNLIKPPGRIHSGGVFLDGEDLTAMPQNRLREIRGRRISMIFQDPMATLNPVLSIGQQMTETLHAHFSIGKPQAKLRALQMLQEVSVPSPESRFNAYPHELSGGLRQRVVIAIALLTAPQLIIADEPTTALDVTIQAEIMALLTDLCEKKSLSLILITHDLAVVSQVAPRLAVMYAGQIVEQGDTDEIISNPRHPYTRGLLATLPQQNRPGEKLRQIPGRMPSPDELPTGCTFHPRCPYAGEMCKRQNPPLRLLGPSHHVACLRAEEI